MGLRFPVVNTFPEDHSSSGLQIVGRTTTLGRNTLGRNTSRNALGRNTTRGPNTLGRNITPGRNTLGRNTTLGRNILGRNTTLGRNIAIISITQQVKSPEHTVLAAVVSRNASLHPNKRPPRTQFLAAVARGTLNVSLSLSTPGNVPRARVLAAGAREASDPLPVSPARRLCVVQPEDPAPCWHKPHPRPQEVHGSWVRLVPARCRIFVAGTNLEERFSLSLSPPQVKSPAHASWLRSLEKRLTPCPSLQPGDCVLFNRKILHRVGSNLTHDPRTVLLLQAVFPFGIKMEHLDSDRVCEAVGKWYSGKAAGSGAAYWRELCEKDYQTLKFRLRGPSFPKNMEA